MNYLKIIFTIAFVLIFSSCAKQDDGYAPSIEFESGSQELKLDSEISYVRLNESHAIGVSGGRPPYHLELSEGEGRLDPDTGVYTAPNQVTLAKVTVADSAGSTVVSQIAVIAPLAIPTENLILHYGENYTVIASGGFESYTYTVLSGAGTLIQNASVIFIAPFFDCNVVLRITDTSGQFIDLNIQVIP
jgi:hypothetical protein